MNPILLKTIENLDVSSIPKKRKSILDTITTSIQNRLINNLPVNINFICTHNSRRSHLSQIWMQTFAHYFKKTLITCYSGGTEATRIAPQVITTLKNQGFAINKLSNEKNSIYTIKYDKNSMPIIGFSKEYFHNFNPSTDFIAILTCSQADEGCPFVSGSDQRITLTYEDPKMYDNTELEKQKYIERSTQIATELFYIINSLI